jgi:hypothetical protein
LHFPVRVRAFLGATLVVAVLWLITVVAVREFVSSSPNGRQAPRLNGAGKIVIRRNGKLHIITLHPSFGNAFDFAAWHKVALVLTLVTLAALAVAVIDWLRRKSRRTRWTEREGPGLESGIC